MNNRKITPTIFRHLIEAMKNQETSQMGIWNGLNETCTIEMMYLSRTPSEASTTIQRSIYRTTIFDFCSRMQWRNTTKEREKRWNIGSFKWNKCTAQWSHDQIRSLLNLSSGFCDTTNRCMRNIPDPILYTRFVAGIKGLWSDEWGDGLDGQRKYQESPRSSKIYLSKRYLGNWRYNLRKLFSRMTKNIFPYSTKHILTLLCHSSHIFYMLVGNPIVLNSLQNYVVAE